MKKTFFTVSVLFLAILLISGCKKDKGDPPELPPAESMLIDFSNFTSAKKSAEILPSAKGTQTSNWEYAAGVAGVWKLILNMTLAVPVTVFKTAVNQTPVNVSGKTWQWSYNATYLNISYKARLTGAIDGNKVDWKMYITREGANGFTDFLWFEGTSQTDGTSGTWIFYQEPDLPDQLLKIDWAKTSTTIGNIKYTNLKNDNNKDSYIEYGLTSNALNAFYNIHYYHNTSFYDVNVEWNTTTHNGRVKSPDYLGDSNWYCWDANRLNVVCN